MKIFVLRASKMVIVRFAKEIHMTNHLSIVKILYKLLIQNYYYYYYWFPIISCFYYPNLLLTYQQRRRNPYLHTWFPFIL